MKKLMFSIVVCTLLLGIPWGISVDAYTGTGTTTIGYISDSSSIKMDIEGEVEVIKGTAGHPYHLTADGKEVSAVWNIRGATSKNTKIDAGGFLNIGVDEKATELEIIGYSAENPNRYATYKVKLTEKTYSVVNIEKKPDLTMPYGTTEEQLLNKLEAYNTFQVTLKSNDGKTYVIAVDRAFIYSDEAVIQSNGIVRKGSFKINYELIMPFVQIDYDGSVYTDKNGISNITGDKITGITVTIKDTGTESPSGHPSEDGNKHVNGSVTSPNTGDATNTKGYAAILSIGAVMLLITFNRKRHEKDEEHH